MQLDLIEPHDGDAGADELAFVPMPSGGCLHIAWGAGNELLIAGLPADDGRAGGIAAGAPSDSSAMATAAAVQW